jgi:hypothetical protein
MVLALSMERGVTLVVLTGGLSNGALELMAEDGWIVVESPEVGAELPVAVSESEGDPTGASSSVRAFLVVLLNREKGKEGALGEGG